MTKEVLRMIQYFGKGIDLGLLAMAGLMVAFLVTCYLLHKFADKLPHDLGRDFAFNGKMSEGKPRGAGFIFILVFVATSLLFVQLQTELIIYLILVVAAMMTGFLDDCSRNPWGEYKKGILDLIIALMTGFTFLNFNTNAITIATLHKEVVIPAALFLFLAVILVWVSINVTNCSDGVDGLSGSLTIVTLLTIYSIDQIKHADSQFSYMILLFVICILGYLWFNATPSKMMMGDAGSRAMGLFIAIAILKTGSPFLYVPVAAVLILDGGLGLIKVSVMRFLHVKFLTKVRTPLHDQARKVSGWSNTQTVFRFVIIQVMIGVAVIYLIQ